MKYSKKVFMVASSLYAAGMLSSGFAYAGDLPSGGQVVDGGASISQQGDTLNIDQSTDKAVIDWNSFSVGKGNTVNFNQPASDSATLNRVTGNFTSEIAGQINANGSVFLVNPNGIMITKDGVIDTGNFVASTLDIDNNDFMNGDYTFTKNGQNGVVDNRGSIAVDDGGFVALLGGAVKNTGTVRAHVGKVGFAGGEKIVMSFGNNDFLRVEVPTDKWENLTDSQGNKVFKTVDLGGTIESRGGFIDIAVADAADILRQSISISGVVSANTVSSTDGVISISGGSLGVLGNGRITADADYGNAGTINIDVDSIDGNGQFSAASQNGTGGTIKVSLQQGADLTDGTSFDVSGRTAGGTLSFIGGLSGKGGSKILGSIDFKADSTDGKGGYIDISNKGGLVGLFSGTISASGNTQGGRIRLGGAFQGGGYDPKTSQLDKKTQDLFVTRWSDNSSLVSAGKTSLGTGVNVVVSSASGKGGTAILWADNTTNNYAAIDATGATGGGAVEISGKKEVDSFGLARVKAGDGVILLDPENLVLGTTPKVDWGDAVSQIRAIAAYSASGQSVSNDNSSADHFGSAVALSNDGSRIAIGAEHTDGNKGAVYVYTVNSSGGKWATSVSYYRTIKHGTGAKIESSGGSVGAVNLVDYNQAHYFGSSVALSGDGEYLAVGARFGGSAGKGEVSLFKIQGTLVRKARIQYGGSANGDRLVLPGSKSNPWFGSSIAISDDKTKIAIGAQYEQAVYLFNMKTAGDASSSTDPWAKKHLALTIAGGKYAKLEKAYGWGGLTKWKEANGGDHPIDDNSHFGTSLAFSSDGRKLVVGDRTGHGDPGEVHLLKTYYDDTQRKVSGVDYVTKLTHSSVNNDHRYGASVALSGDGTRLVVGAAPLNKGEGAGAVYLYTIDTSKWHIGVGGRVMPQLLKKVDGKIDGSVFGDAVALDDTGTKLAVGVPEEGNGSVKLMDITVAAATDDSTAYEAQLNKGTNVILTANNDITINVDIVADSGSGKLTLIAGRSILVNQDIDIKGSLELRANAAKEQGLVLNERETGNGVVTVANTKKLEAGKDLIIKMLADEGQVAAYGRNGTGAVTVGKVKGERVSIVYEDYVSGYPVGTQEIIIRSGGQIEATKSGVSLELKADKFTNQSDKDALKVTALGRYLVWTKNFNDNTMGGITNYDFVEFNKSHGGSAWGSSGLKGVASGFVYTLNPAQLKVTANTKTKQYDGNEDGPSNNLKVASGGSGGLDFAVSGSPSGGHKKFYLTNAASLSGKFYKTGTTSFVSANEQKDAGTGLVLNYDLSGSLAFKDGNGKTVHGLSATYQNVTDASITKRELLFVHKIGNDRHFNWSARTYDGTDNITVTQISGKKGFDDSDVVSGESVTLTVDTSKAFKLASKNAGSDSIQVKDASAFVLSGGYESNYKLVLAKDANGGGDLKSDASIPGMTATIRKKTLTIDTSAFTVSDKFYDGTRKATVSWSGSGLQGVISGDKVKIDGSFANNAFTFASADVSRDGSGNAQKQAVTYSSGSTPEVSKSNDADNADAKNYVIDSGVSFSGLEAIIKPRVLVLDVVELKAVTREYDATAKVTVNPITDPSDSSNNKDGFADTDMTGQAGYVAGSQGKVVGDDVALDFAANANQAVGSRSFKYASGDADVGTNKKVYVDQASTIGLTGAKAGNYDLKVKNSTTTYTDITDGYELKVGGYNLTGEITKRKLYLNLDELQVKGVASNDGEQIYDGDTEADVKLKTGNGGDGFFDRDSAAGNVISGENVNLTVGAGAFKYANANVNAAGNGKKDVLFADVSKITLNTAGDGKNYDLYIKSADNNPKNDIRLSTITSASNTDSTIDGKITQRVLVMDGSELKAAERAYDGTTGVTVTVDNGKDGFAADNSNNNTKGAIAADVSGANPKLTLSIGSGAFAYANKDVEFDSSGDPKNKQIQIGTASDLSLSGTAAGNYVLQIESSNTEKVAAAGDTVDGLQGKIVKKKLTIVGSSVDRVYDGTTAVAWNTTGLTGWVSGEQYKTGNVLETLADIRQSSAALKGQATSADANSDADGNLLSGMSETAVSFASGNDLTLKDTAKYNNYELNAVASDTVRIKRRKLILDTSELVASDRTYDGSNVAVVALKSGVDSVTNLSYDGITNGQANNTGLLAGDRGKVLLNVASGAFVYANRNVALDDSGDAADKQIKVGTLALRNAPSADLVKNYELRIMPLSGSDKAAANGDDIKDLKSKITHRVLKLDGSELTATTRTYNGDKWVKVGLKSGQDSNSLAYDGFATKQDSDESGLVSADEGVVKLKIDNTESDSDASFLYASENVGSGKQIQIGKASSLVLEGVGNGNYVLQVIDTSDSLVSKADDVKVGGLTGTVDQKVLLLTADPTSRVYDGTANLAFTNVDVTGWVASEKAALDKDLATIMKSGSSTLTATADSKNVGNGRAVTFSGVALKETSGTYGNYQLTLDTTKTVNITKKTLTLTASPTSRVYNGDANLAFTGVSVTGWVSSEQAALDKDLATIMKSGSSTLTATADSENVGNDRAVTFSGVALKETVGTYGNYELALDTTKKVNITPKTLTLTADPTSRVYNGSTSLDYTNLSITGWVSGESGLSGNLSKTMKPDSVNKFAVTADSKNAGTRSVTFGGAVLKDDAGTYGNYRLTFDTTKTVNITRRFLVFKHDDYTVIDSLDTGAVVKVNGADGIVADVTKDKDAYGKDKYGYYSDLDLLGNTGLVSGDDGNVKLTLEAGAAAYGDKNLGNDKSIYVADKSKFKLEGAAAGNYRLSVQRNNLPSGTDRVAVDDGALIANLRGSVVGAGASGGSGGGQELGTPGGGGGGGGGGGAIVLVGAGVAAVASGVIPIAAVTGGAAAGAAGAAGAGAGAAGAGAGGAGAGALSVPVGSIESIFNTGIYAYLNGINMQAISHPLDLQPTQSTLASVFNTAQPSKVKYKVKYTTSYDLAFLANNIKAQKMVPVYELDEELYETIKQIFVQQSVPANETASIDTDDNSPA